MSTTDIKVEFEEAIKRTYPLASLARNMETGGYRSGTTDGMWWAWQAATEAAKATGTAGEQEPWQALDFGDVPFPGHWAASWPVTQQRGYIDGYRAAVKAEAARQPALALPVKTWQERLKEGGWEDYTAMLAEIADLRAALAATAAPVVPLGLRSVERDTDKRVAFIFYDKQDADRFDADMRVSLAANRSQP